MNNLKPPLKILLFSQFTDVLNVLAISLKLNAISYLQFTSNKILQQFRQDPTITVLLMPLGKGFFSKIIYLFNSYLFYI
jgi:SNF2 family DNA or RNA helicase